MLYKEIEGIEVDRIVGGIRRLLDIGFTMEEINESTHKGIKQMVLNLPTEKIYEMNRMRQIKKKVLDEEKSDIK